MEAKEARQDTKSSSFELFWRTASLLSIMVGSLLLGSGLFFDLQGNLFVALTAGSAICLSALGGTIGLVLVGMGCMLLGAVLGDIVPTSLFNLWLPIMAPGLVFRIFCSD
ncbi:hypothetical protein [Pseudomonas aeruginosa]|uniref:hypothetical protein n=1 Tax=Pseudomonas aeruginosa TaxID=287 RepID=UPI0032B33B48